MTRIRLLAAAVLVLVIIAGGLAYVSGTFRSQSGSTVEIGGPFVLASSKGGEVSSESLKGKPYAVFFGFTHCPEICPTTLYEMSSALTKLGDDAKDFRVFFITVDPERDTLPAMKDYIANFDPRIEALVPTPEQLQKLARDFRIYFAKSPTSDGSYTMDHTASIFLMNADGKFSGTIAFGEAPEMRDAKLRRLLTGS
jgi:protein SCO1/2